MKGPFLEEHEIKQLEHLLHHSAQDTINCWIATRINGASASLSCEGNISIKLLKELDKMVLPLIQNNK